MVLWLPVFALAEDNDAALLFQQGIDAYNNEHYDLAVESFRQLPALGYTSADLYYNLGNAYYRLGEPANAIWCYEKALLINPAHDDARFNLEFVNNEIFAGANTVPPSVFKEIRAFIYTLMSPSSWIVLLIILQIILPVLVLVFFFSASSRKRKLFFYLSAVIFVFYLLSFGVSAWAYYSLKNPSKAVISSQSAPVRSEPGNGGTDIVVVEHGSTVHILEHSDEWIKIELPDGNIGWVLAANAMDLSMDLP